MVIIAQTFTTDTLPQPGTTPSLEISRQTLDPLVIRSTTTDSVKPKPVAVIKVKPFIPYSDTVGHPTYNVLTRKFELSKPDNLFKALRVNPLQLQPVAATNMAPALPADTLLVATDSTTTDSVFADTVLVKVTQVVTPKVIMPSQTIKKDFSHTDGMLVAIIGVFVFFVWLRIGFNRFLNDVVNAAFNYFSARRFYEEANALRNRVFNFMNVFFVLTIALFTWQWFNYQNLDFLGFQNLVQYLMLVAAWGLIYLLRTLIMHILEFVFLAKGGFITYHYNVFIYNKLLAFVLLPVTAVLPFVPSYMVPWLFIGGGGAFALSYLMRLIRGLQIGLKNRLSIFYLILYLCALEILPILVLIKLVQVYF